MVITPLHQQRGRTWVQGIVEYIWQNYAPRGGMPMFQGGFRVLTIGVKYYI